MDDKRKPKVEPYKGPAGGWGSLKSVGSILAKEKAPLVTARELMRQNKADGFMCVSCAWAKPVDAHPFEFCENGAKATAWELTSERTGPEFFAEHTLTELLGWSDHELERHGRLTHPMRYDRDADKYVPCE
ncbi:MAG: FdhF/YdeP family oxidoreductase, partial [Rhodanobacteraceae bacterium]